MIVDSTSSTKQSFGINKEYKTTIDIENLDFIATLLSSNLYSNPEESFVREIVSNGWDSHVEAGNTDTPILVRFKRDANYNYYITIRDYGTGLSEEDFENLYCKIGSSTKRHSNDYLGMFGLGHLSPLSVSKVVYIKSYYEGVVRFYIMTKDGNNITTNLMSETPTTEHNGLEITVKNLETTNFSEAFKKLVFFPNVYIDGVWEQYNNIKIKRYKYFSFAKENFKDKLLLGNVLYPLDKTIIPSDLLPFYNALENTGVVINFNIGELSVTPNREAIIYNSKVNALIIDRIRLAKKEIADIIQSKIKLDTDNLGDYISYTKYSKRYDFIKDEFVDYDTRYPHFYLNQVLGLPVTIKGKSIDTSIAERVQGLNLENLDLKAVLHRNYWWKGKYPWRASNVIRDPKSSIIVIGAGQKLTKYITDYLAEKYTSLLVFGTLDFTAFVKGYENTYHKYSQIAVTTEELEIIKLGWEDLQKRITTIDINTDADLIAYKEAKKQEAKANKVKIKDVILTLYLPERNYGHKRTFNTYEDALKYLKTLNKGILFRNLDCCSIASLAGALGYVVVAANKKIIDLLKKESLTCAITENTIISHKYVTQYLAFRKSKLYSVRDSIYDNNKFSKSLNKELQEGIRKISLLDTKLNFWAMNNYIDSNDSIKADEDFEIMCNKIYELYTKYNTYVTSMEISNQVACFIHYGIMKNKLYRINNECYKKIKNNKFLQSICK